MLCRLDHYTVHIHAIQLIITKVCRVWGVDCGPTAVTLVLYLYLVNSSNQCRHLNSVGFIPGLQSGIFHYFNKHKHLLSLLSTVL